MSFIFNTGALSSTGWRSCGVLALTCALAACGGGTDAGANAELTKLEIGSLSIPETSAPVYVQSGETVRLQTQGQATFEVSGTQDGVSSFSVQ